MKAALVWESVTWRCGSDHYRFEIERGGLFATLEAPGDRKLTLPMIVWDGLLDALTAKRSTRKRYDQSYAPRSRSRWYDGEVAELVTGYRSGQSLAELAKLHNRTEYAIEHQLDKVGLMSTAEKYGPAGLESSTGQVPLSDSDRVYDALPDGIDERGNDKMNN